MAIACEDGRCTVEGALTMRNATAVLAEALPLFTAARIVVDLAGVTEVDSAAVSLLLEWRRQAAKDRRVIEYANVPANLNSLAELYGVAHLI